MINRSIAKMPNFLGNLPGMLALIVVDIATILLLLLLLAQIFLLRDQLDFARGALWKSALLAGLLILLFIVIIQMLRGRQQALPFYIVLCTLIASCFIAENVSLLNYVYSYSETKDWTLRTWWQLSSGVRWIIWLSIHYWYMFKIKNLKKK